MIPPRRKGKLDTSVNLQRLLMWLAGVIAVCVLGWFALQGRVQSLEDHDRSQDARMTRLEATIVDLRGDNRDAWRDVNQSIKDLSNKIDQMKDNMYANAVHPELNKWSKQ